MAVVTKLVVKEPFCHVLMIINTKQTTKNFSENIFEQNAKTAALKTELIELEALLNILKHQNQYLLINIRSPVQCSREKG